MVALTKQLLRNHDEILSVEFAQVRVQATVRTGYQVRIRTRPHGCQCLPAEGDSVRAVDVTTSLGIVTKPYSSGARLAAQDFLDVFDGLALHEPGVVLQPHDEP